MATKHIAQHLIWDIYRYKVYSPFEQLLLIEKVIREGGITWKQLTAQINAQTKDLKHCISCQKKTSKPCHLIDTKILREIRDSRKRSGNARKGKGHSTQRKGDKAKLIEQIIIAMGERRKLNDVQIYNLRTYLEPIRIELLVMMLGDIAVPVWGDEEEDFGGSGI